MLAIRIDLQGMAEAARSGSQQRRLDGPPLATVVRMAKQRDPTGMFGRQLIEQGRRRRFAAIIDQQAGKFQRREFTQHACEGGCVVVAGDDDAGRHDSLTRPLLASGSVSTSSALPRRYSKRSWPSP